MYQSLLDGSHPPPASCAATIRRILFCACHWQLRAIRRKEFSVHICRIETGYCLGESKIRALSSCCEYCCKCSFDERLCAPRRHSKQRWRAERARLLIHHGAATGKTRNIPKKKDSRLISDTLFLSRRERERERGKMKNSNTIIIMLQNFFSSPSPDDT